MGKKLFLRSLLSILVLTACSRGVNAQSEVQQLTATILHLDSAFWNAYNNCDTAQFKNFVTDSVEFYHDKGGLLRVLQHLLNRWIKTSVVMLIPTCEEKPLQEQ